MKGANNTFYWASFIDNELEGNFLFVNRMFSLEFFRKTIRKKKWEQLALRTVETTL